MPIQVDAFAINPLRQTFTVDPGRSVKVQLEVSNRFDDMVSVEPSVAAFSIHPKDGSVQPADYSEALRWIIPQQRQVDVPSGQTRVLEYDIAIPDNADPGAHYIMLLATQKNGSQVQAELGSLLFLYVAGEVQETLSVESFSSLKKVYWGGVPEITMQLRNKGTIHLVPRGQLTFETRQGVKQQFDVNPETKKMFPGVRLTEDFSINSMEKGDVGKVQAQLVVQYGVSGGQIIRTIDFYYIPKMYLVLAALVGVSLILVLRVFVAKKHAIK